MGWTDWIPVPGAVTTDLAPAAYGGAQNLLLTCTQQIALHIFLNTLDPTGKWSGWQEAPGRGTTDAAPAVQGTGAKPTYLFAKGINDHSINQLSLADPAAVWIPVPGRGTTDDAPSVAYVQEGWHLFAIGSSVWPPPPLPKEFDDQHIYENVLSNVTGVWEGWAEVGGGGTTDRAVSAAPFGDTLYLFSKGINDKRHYMNTNRAGAWSGWEEVPGGGTTDAAPNALVSGGFLYLFGKGIDDRRVWVKKFDILGTAGWSQWEPVGNLTTNASVSAAELGANLDVYVFATGDDGIVRFSKELIG